MDAGVVSALITGFLALAGVIISNILGNSKIQASLDKAQAVTDTKLEELTREVRSHNEFCVRIPVLENKVEVIEERLKKNGG